MLIALAAAAISVGTLVLLAYLAWTADPAKGFYDEAIYHRERQ